MSPHLATRLEYTDCFPRVSGDEPLLSLVVGDCQAFSPRERG